MEVLEKGKDVEWKREIMCPHCKSRMLIIAADVKYEDSVCLGSGRYYVICHGHKIYLGRGESDVLADSDISQHVKYNAKKRWELNKGRNIARNVAKCEKQNQKVFIMFALGFILFIIVIIKALYDLGLL